ncbi:MAG: CDP-glycerol glycerophosphotransferase family protein [Clostridium sp.]|nr:CDP-glycerol glycerophosphotransferase family protein [Clostridium sp.]
MKNLKEKLKKNKFILKSYFKFLDLNKKLKEKFLWFIYTKIKIKSNKIVVDSFSGNGYSDNPKYIVEEILKQNLNYDIVWIINNSIKENNIPLGIRTVKYGTSECIYELATAKVWIDNARKMYKTKKRSGQFYIQTWHGTYPIKKVENDTIETLGKEYINYAKIDSKNADLFISNGKHMSDLYRKSFWYDGEILEKGCPKNDILIKKPHDVYLKVKNNFNIEQDTKILLYAPTFRNSESLEPYNLDYDNLLKVLKKKFGGNWVVLVRLHPNISMKSKELKLKKNVYDATNYEDIQELLIASDILITDYSSTSSDYIFTGKPCFLFTTDFNEYLNERELYVDINNICFKKANNNEELFRIIEEFDYKKYNIQREKYMLDLGMFETGQASKYVVEWIKNKINN